jgi:hypothetical protein
VRGFGFGLGALGQPFTVGLGFSLDAFMAAFSDGFAFDFTKTDRHFQTSTGPTLADDVTDPIGLALESREWNGRTLAEELATQAELRGGGVTGSVGTPPAGAATFNTSTGVGSVSRTDVSNQSFVSIPVTDSNATYVVDLEVTSGLVGNLTIRDHTTAVIYVTFTSEIRQSIFVAAPGATIRLQNLTNPSDSSFILHSVKLVPTHHGVQSSSSLRGARAVFYGYSDDQPNLAEAWGDFASSSGWTLETGWAISGGAMSRTAASASNALREAGLEVGQTYRCRFTVSDADAINIRNGSQYLFTSGAGRRTLVFTATDTNFGFNTGQDGFSIDDVEIRLIPASRVTTGCKYDGSDDNHLTTYKANMQLGPELLSDPSFDVPASWSAAPGWTISGGKATFSGTSGNLSPVPPIYPSLLGALYAVSGTISDRTTGGVFVSVGSTGPAFTANGDFQIYVSADVLGSQFRFYAYSSFDGSLDNISVKEVTNQDNFIVAYVNVPTTISAFQYILASNEVGNTNRFGIGINTDGKIGFAAGNTSPAVAKGTTDWRGKSVVVGLSSDGTTVTGFVDQAIEYSASLSGVLNNTTPVRIGAANVSGTAALFFAGTIENVIAGPEYLNLARYLQIRNKLIDP